MLSGFCLFTITSNDQLNRQIMLELISNGFASLETAKKLEEKGYNTPIDFVIRRINFHCESTDPEVREDPANWIEWEAIVNYDPNTKSFEQKLDNGAIKKQQIIPLVKSYLAPKWFRDEHKLHVTIYSCSQESWMYRITKQGQKLEEGIYAEDFSSYEEALDDALQKMCELI